MKTQRWQYGGARAGVFLMAALINGVAAAAPGDLLFTLTAADPQQGAFFGDMVRSVDGEILISETSRRYLPINVTGRAYLYDGQTGQLKWTFENPEPTNLDDFARAIAGGDRRVFISTIGVEERVYGFSTVTGELLYSMTNPVPNNNFGTGVAYGNGSVLVSAPSFSLPGMNAVGQAYLFDATNGQVQLTLANPEPKAGDVFGGGMSVAIIGNRAIVGAAFDDLPSDVRPDGDNPGRVWVFDRLTGETLVTLENPNADNQLPPNSFSDRFGAR